MRSYALAPAWLMDADAQALVQAGQPSGHISLLTMGSSEFSANVPQNPGRFLYRHSSDFDLRYSGKAWCQTLYHATQLAALAPRLQNRKATLVVSPQWFTGNKPELFQAVFSNSYWQAMLNSPAISDDTKLRLLHRTASLTQDPVWFSDLTEGALRTPYDAAVRRARVLREQAAGLQAVAHYDRPWEKVKGCRPARSIDWVSARREAAAQTEAEIRNNPYNIADSYFTTHLATKLDALQGSQADWDYSRDSTEWDDLDLLFAVAAEARIDLLVIGVPMNGAWYDFLGYDGRRRAKFADRLQAACSRAGVQFASFFDHEYDRGFLCDPSHLGWKGWLDVSQAMVNFAAP